MRGRRGKTAKDYRELLRAGRWFAGLPEGLQDALLDLAQLRACARREPLFLRGDAPDGLYGVLEGAVRVSGGDEAGREALFTLVEHPFWFGEISAFDGQPRTHDAVAERESLLAHVPQGPLLALLEREPRHWRSLGLLLTGKLRLSFAWIEDGALLPLPARLARRLLLMAEGYGGWDGRQSRVLHVRQEQLASMLATSRQTMNGLLGQLAEEGALALVYGGVEIRDLAALRRAAGAG